MIIAYSTGRTRLTKVIWDLKNIDSRYIVYPNNINHFLNFIKQCKPSFVLGMGTYSGRDKDKIRIETQCTNGFKNTYLEVDESLGEIVDNLQKLTLPSFIEPDENFKLAKGIGISYCNFSAYQITSLILKEKLRTKFSFLHIPKAWKIDDIVIAVEKKMGEIRVE